MSNFSFGLLLIVDGVDDLLAHGCIDFVVFFCHGVCLDGGMIVGVMGISSLGKRMDKIV